MPAEIPNHLATSLPAFERNITTRSSSRKTISLATELKRFKFVLALPVFSVDILPSYARSCLQCQKPYNYDFEVAGKRTGHEAPALLPCNCVVGFHCARQWLSPYELGFVSCPLCDEAFPEMFDEPRIDSHTTKSTPRIEIPDIKGKIVAAQEDLVMPIAQMIIGADASQENRWQLPGIDEVLSANSRISKLKPLDGLETPDIIIAAPENGVITKRERGVAAIKAADLIMK